MADNEEQPRSREELGENPLVERLVPDPSQPAQPVVVLVGLLGRSAREGYWRLYLTWKLNQYAEFREEDVLNSEKMPQEQSPRVGLELTRLWLRRDATTEYRHTKSWLMQAEFLSGAIAEGFQARAAAAGTLGAPQPALFAAHRGESPCGSPDVFCSINCTEGCPSAHFGCTDFCTARCTEWVCE